MAGVPFVVVVVGADVIGFVGRFVVGGGAIVGRQRGLIEGIGLIDFLARLRWAGVNRYILKPKPVEFFAERVLGERMHARRVSSS